MTLSTNNNTSVLPFYGSTDFWEGAKEQDFKKSYAFGYTYCLATPANTILPFQIIRPHSNNPIREVRLYEKGSSNPIKYILREMQESGLQVASFTEYGYDVIVYPGILPMALNLLDGQYYISIHDGQYSWYSDIFTVVHDLSKYIKLEWWDAEDLVFRKGRVVYKNPNFKNALYLCTELGKPDYEFKEEGEQRDGYFFPEKQISEKTYKCSILGPEYLCDVMCLIRMSDYIKITDQLGRIYNCDTFLISPKWQVQGNLASVEIEFQTDTIVKKIGRGRLKNGYLGDFNESYNTDYLLDKKWRIVPKAEGGNVLDDAYCNRGNIIRDRYSKIYSCYLYVLNPNTEYRITQKLHLESASVFAGIIEQKEDFAIGGKISEIIIQDNPNGELQTKVVRYDTQKYLMIQGKTSEYNRFIKLEKSIL